MKFANDIGFPKKLVKNLTYPFSITAIFQTLVVLIKILINSIYTLARKLTALDVTDFLNNSFGAH